MSYSTPCSCPRCAEAADRYLHVGFSPRYPGLICLSIAAETEDKDRAVWITPSQARSLGHYLQYLYLNRDEQRRPPA